LGVKITRTNFQNEKSLPMTQIAVMVIGENPEDQLDSFQKINFEDSPKDRLEFKDMEELYRRVYNSSGEKMIVSPNGEMFFPWDTNRPSISNGNAKNYYIKKFIPYKELFKTFDAYMHAQGLKHDKITGKFGYWYDPMSKIDWYELGGRYSGFFIIKPNAKGVQGEHLLDVFELKRQNYNDLPKNYCDQCRKRDIDFEQIKLITRVEAAQEYFQFIDKLGTHPLPPKWNEFRESYNSIADAREYYNNHPSVKALSSYNSFQEFLNGEKEYIDYRVKCRLDPYAIVINGEWKEVKESDHFDALDDQGQEQKMNWVNRVSQMITEMPDETLLSLYDCHI